MQTTMMGPSTVRKSVKVNRADEPIMMFGGSPMSVAVPPMFDSPFPGVMAMGAAVLAFFFMPWLDRGAVKSIRYRGPIYRAFFAAFIVSFLVLGYLGVEPTNVWGEFGKGVPLVGGDYIATWVARILTAVYFAFFLLMPWYTAIDKEKPVPQRVTY
mgnify:CR=1 FL=1